MTLVHLARYISHGRTWLSSPDGRTDKPPMEPQRVHFVHTLYFSNSGTPRTLGISWEDSVNSPYGGKSQSTNPMIQYVTGILALTFVAPALISPAISFNSTIPTFGVYGSTYRDDQKTITVKSITKESILDVMITSTCHKLIHFYCLQT